MEIRFNGYKTWKHIKEELDMFDLYILPSVIVYRDWFGLQNQCTTSIKFAWLFWELNIYFERQV